MNQKELSFRLAEKLNISKQEGLHCIKTLVEIITEELAKKNPVSIMGFGRIFPLRQASRVARNPKTGESVVIEERTTVRFRPGSVLFNDINK